MYAVTNHTYFAILVIQSAFSIALALIIFKIASRIFDERVGLLAVAVVAFHPGFIYYDVFNLIPLSIDSFLIASITLLLLKHKDKPALLAMSLLGGLIGLGVLSRGITGVLLPLAIVYFALLARSLTHQARFKITVCLAGGALIILAPWLIRNYLIHKQLVFISSNASENFWRGNNMHATGTSHNSRGVSIFKSWPDDFKEKVYSMTELQQKSFFETEALSFIGNHPLTGLNLYVKKVFYFWWFSPQTGIVYPGIYLTLYKFMYMILFSFIIAGIGFALTSSGSGVRESSLILIAVPVTICLGQSLFFVEGRHRWLVEPIMIIFCSYGVVECGKLLQRKWRVGAKESSP